MCLETLSLILTETHLIIGSAFYNNNNNNNNNNKTKKRKHAH